MLLFSTSLGFNIKRVVFSPEVRQLPQKRYGRRPFNTLIQPSDKAELLPPVDKVQKVSFNILRENIHLKCFFLDSKTTSCGEFLGANEVLPARLHDLDGFVDWKYNLSFRNHRADIFDGPF